MSLSETIKERILFHKKRREEEGNIANSLYHDHCEEVYEYVLPEIEQLESTNKKLLNCLISEIQYRLQINNSCDESSIAMVELLTNKNIKDLIDPRFKI